jgi:hypothetical protein
MERDNTKIGMHVKCLVDADCCGRRVKDLVGVVKSVDPTGMMPVYVLFGNGGGYFNFHELEPFDPA